MPKSTDKKASGISREETIKVKLWRVGASGAIPVPIDWLRELDWHPSYTSVYLTKTKEKGLQIEKAKEGSGET